MTPIYKCRKHDTVKVFISDKRRCLVCRHDERERERARNWARPCKRCKGFDRVLTRRDDGLMYMVCMTCTETRRKAVAAARAANPSKDTPWRLAKERERAKRENEQRGSGARERNELIELAKAACRLDAIRAAGMRLHDQREATRREWEKKAREQRQGARV